MRNVSHEPYHVSISIEPRVVSICTCTHTRARTAVGGLGSELLRFVFSGFMSQGSGAVDGLYGGHGGLWHSFCLMAATETILGKLKHFMLQMFASCTLGRTGLQAQAASLGV